eukprot:TRINITY_DN2561_c0_g2_i1.p2 TRINITY_DN2561_c0_g2~~TRINITY_DN2561_c0_g2_i1.p2  ORF type:complete len:323 (+),score=108.67 TRINITY_DN2561_c0_g2_i1:71-1039(+)
MVRIGAAALLAGLVVAKGEVLTFRRLRASGNATTSQPTDDIQSLKKEVQELRARETAQESKNAALETQLEDLKTQFSNFKAGQQGTATKAKAASAQTSSAKSKQPCQCVAQDPSWVAPTRTTPKCIFIDLGAANGNTFQKFMSNGYGPIANCPSGDYEAWLVEANPRFKPELDNLQTQYQGKVHAMASTAAYDCEAQTSFYVDTVNVQQNFWGSSMSDTHPDTKKSGLQKVTVPTVNLNRMVYENTIPGDWVLVKVDIEGSEWDVVPCLSTSPSARLVDRMLLEVHPMDWQLGTTTREGMDAALAALKAGGTDIPQYFSETF